MEVLKQTFGRPKKMISQIPFVRKFLDLTEGMLVELPGFKSKVRNLTEFQEAADGHRHLFNPTLMKELILKLPPQ